MDNVLSIQGLKVDIISHNGIVHAIRGINLDLRQGEIHGFVGESGSGKTMTAKSILRLIDEKKAIYSGKIMFNEVDILTLRKKQLKEFRGREISMIFQDPTISLNPLITIGEQISEMLRRHLRMGKADAHKEAIDLLEKVGIHPAESRFGQYPFQLSGGMLQRIMIAIAIACKPKILIADEPTTALDVTIQAQMLELLKKLQQDDGMTIFFVTHNFGVVAEICDRVSVMYAGKIVETGRVEDIFKNPLHPYTKALMSSIPKVGQHGKRLDAIAGSPPELLKEIKGCSFCPRCPYALEMCSRVEPDIKHGEEGHHYACFI